MPLQPFVHAFHRIQFITEMQMQSRLPSASPCRVPEDHQRQQADHRRVPEALLRLQVWDATNASFNTSHL